MYLDVMPTGNIKLNFPGIDPTEMKDSCVLDIAERVRDHNIEFTYDEVSRLFNITRERARQLEGIAFGRMLARARREGL